MFVKVAVYLLHEVWVVTWHILGFYFHNNSQVKLKNKSSSDALLLLHYYCDFMVVKKEKS
jgi:hypothetical protein